MKKVLTILSFISICILSTFVFSACDNNNKDMYIINFMIEKELYDNVITTGDEEITLPLNPTKIGYKFDGWYIINDSQQIKISNTYFKNNPLNSNVKVYAKFLPNTLNIFLDANGGACSTETLTISFGDEYELPIPQRDGYDFVGWYSNNVKIENNTWIYDIQTIQAKWEQIYIFSGNIINSLTEYGKTLTEIEIPAQIDGKDIKYIDEYAFKDCTGLTKVIVPTTIEEIGLGAFSGCSSLTEITLPYIGAKVDATDISGTSTFGYIFGSEQYVGGEIANQDYDSRLKLKFYIPRTLKTVYITSGQRVPFNAFADCKYLEKIYLPQTITLIRDYAFHYCTALKILLVPESVDTIGYNNLSENCKIYYLGTEQNSLIIGTLSKATVYYYSEKKPIESGNYWHYNPDDNSILIWG